jgi:RNA polymerase sigma factor (TIGR02999 family)
MTGMNDVTDLLARWRAGDLGARDTLLRALYPALRALAQRELSAGARISLRATELANEAFLRLVDQRAPWQNKTHFLAIAAHVVRRVVVDLIRERAAEKRGANVDFVTLRQAEHVDAELADEIDWLALDSALSQLERRDAQAAQLVELRYFAGMSNAEAAEHLGVSIATATRVWQFARAFLHRRLEPGRPTHS